jgi:DNA-binding GntR family transcriptional regulator
MPSELLAPLPASVSKSDQLAAEIRAAIRDGRLEPGRVYSAQELATVFRVSRTPVREALLRLADAGLVEMLRNRGARVLAASSRDIVDVLVLRMTLEPVAAALAAQRMPEDDRAALRATLDAMRVSSDDVDALYVADRSFHEVICAGSGNARAVRLVSGLLDGLTVHGRRSVPVSRTPQQVVGEHAEVADAVLAADPVGASEAMAAHLRSTARHLLEDEELQRFESDAAAWTGRS